MSPERMVALRTISTFRTHAMVVVVLALGVALAGQVAAAPEGASRAAGDPGRASATVAADAAAGRGSGPAIVVAAGDISACAPPNCASARTARLVRRIDPYRVLTLGDTQYSRGALWEFNQEYDKTWGTFRGRTRPVPGNHEYLTPGASGYYNYFGKLAHRGTDGYYSYGIRRWHVVALNSNDGDCSVVGCERGSEQLEWLRRDLAASRSSCVIAYWHHPPWASAGYRGNKRVRDMWQVLARDGADIVLNGHDHNYERFGPRNARGVADRGGVRQFIVGTGGIPLNTLSRPYDGLSRNIIDDRNGVLKLALRANSYRYWFVTASGQVLERSPEISCT